MSLRLLPIARPCSASFARMEGDAHTRFCSSCGKHVHDLSARTEDEARALLSAARGTNVCVRFAKDALGNVRFRSAVLAAAVSLAGCSSPVPTPAAATATTTSASAHLDEVDYDMGDTIPDVHDKCPDEAEVEGAIDDGCPTIPSTSPAPSTATKP